MFSWRFVSQMPDVISDVQTMGLSRVEDFMDEDQRNDPMMSHHLNNNQPSNLLNLDHLTNDPMMSSSTLNHLHQQQLSTIDMSLIDPIIGNYSLMPMHHSNASVESILQSDSDSLISDIDMIAWRIDRKFFESSNFFVSIVRFKLSIVP